MLARHDLAPFRVVSVARTASRRPMVFGAATFLVLLAVILALAWFAYRPGLSGAFLFDDLGSLPKLGATGPVDDWASFLRYITSGTADPTGRPLALLSFLIDARNWPANPYPFKVTNVILHLVNGALLAWVLWKLGCALVPDDTASRVVAASPLGRGESQDHRGIAVAALFGAGAWLLHPLLVSTTLYVVQREAMLPTTFLLLSLLGWMASRRTLACGHVKRAVLGFALSAWLCTLLAVLSKANGALLPLLLLLTEWIVLSRQPMPDAGKQRLFNYVVTLFLVAPSVLLIMYLLAVIPGYVATTPAVRGWTVDQRLLTEPRVLTDYLRLLFVPSAHSSGLFNDAFPVSTDWRHPAATLPSAVLVFALIGTSLALRKRHPAIALALLFYLAAQLMESGWIPLELYFEHRNYLPAMLLFWPIGLVLARPGILRWLRVLAAACILMVLARLTFQRSTLWGDAPHQAQVWAAVNPDSARAQTSDALYNLQSGRPRLAAARLRLALHVHPDDLQIPVNLITAECRLGAVRPATLAAARVALANDRRGGEVAFHWFGEALAMIAKHSCIGLDYSDLQILLDAAQRNPNWGQYVAVQANLLNLQGTLDLAERRPTHALGEFNRALEKLPRPETALSQAATLAVAGYPSLGLAHLNYLATLPPPSKPGFGMPRIHAWVLQRQGYWQHEVVYLRRSLESSAPALPKP